MKKYILGWVLFCTSLWVGVANAQDKLVTTIIGSGSPLYNESRGSASVLVTAGDTKVLVDMGNGTQASLNKLGIKARDLSALVFTHHHLDHNEEFVPLFIGSLLGRKHFSIIGPPDTTKLTAVNLDLYRQDIEYRLSKSQRSLADRKKGYDVRDIVGGESFTIGTLKVSTVEVPHTIHTIAYRFDYQGQSVVITGDLTYTDVLPGLAKNADFMIIDSGGMIMQGAKKKRPNAHQSGKNNSNKKGRVQAHLDLADSSLLAKQSNVSHLVYTHFVPGQVDQQASLAEIRKNYAGKVIFGEDLMVLSTADNSVAIPYQGKYTYPIADTGQKKLYSNDAVISDLTTTDAFFGQDGNYTINDPSYTDNHDGTISDNVTGLMWQQDVTEKLTYQEALAKVNTFQLAGHDDWRLPTLKELYSLIQFTGSVKGEKAINPFIDTRYFSQPLGDSKQGEREIDAQVWSSTEYVGKTMGKDDTVFGVNFVDGRIKGYPKYHPRTGEANKMYFRFVRANSEYGKNAFVDNQDGTISDNATGLMWQASDSTKGMNWEEALAYAENLTLGGYSDWRLPNAKELQSIVDYSRSPETSDSAAIDPIFQVSSIVNEAGEKDYPYYWTSTTHLDGPKPEAGAVYIAFGKALGKMRNTIMDVHGAGAQRSDPKIGEAMSRGPQGDMIRVNNYVRVVRGGEVDASVSQEQIFSYATQPTTNNTVVAPNHRQQRPSQGNRFITRLDKNGDGKVSVAEFKGPANRFKQFDKNNDGYITADEAPTGPPPEKRKAS